MKTRNRSSFYCNCLFNFESKVGGRNAVYVKAKEIWQPHQHLFLIKHLPCSFDCAKSIQLGKYTLKNLKKELPALAKEITTALKQPVLYFDYFNWLVFNGKAEGNKLFYNQILPYRSFFPEEKATAIKKGNRLIVDDEKISIFKGKTLIAKINKENQYKGVLVDFQ